MEHRARRLVDGSLFLLAGYVTFDAIQTLWAEIGWCLASGGVVLLVASVVVMLWLARAKMQVARELGSTAMAAEAFQTTACWWLPLAALGGVGTMGTSVGGGQIPSRRSSSRRSSPERGGKPGTARFAARAPMADAGQRMDVLSAPDPGHGVGGARRPDGMPVHNARLG